MPNDHHLDFGDEPARGYLPSEEARETAQTDAKDALPLSAEILAFSNNPHHRREETFPRPPSDYL